MPHFPSCSLISENHEKTFPFFVPRSLPLRRRPPATDSMWIQRRFDLRMLNKYRKSKKMRGGGFPRQNRRFRHLLKWVSLRSSPEKRKNAGKGIRTLVSTKEIDFTSVDCKSSLDAHHSTNLSLSHLATLPSPHTDWPLRHPRKTQ